jgi:ubiquinone/menaquinone biosynthesis C-methylase UbiE
MAVAHYIIRRGLAGRERLRVLARVNGPATSGLLARLGIEPGMRCLDVGCGGGDVALALARLVGPEGEVVGVDLDEVKLGIAREEAKAAGVANVEYRRGDVHELPPRTATSTSSTRASCSRTCRVRRVRWAR